MKLITFLSLILLFSIPSFSQEEIEVDEVAEYIGGNKELFKRIQSEINTNKLPKGTSGKVMVKFIVDESGKVSNAEIVKGLRECRECEIEALRVIRSLDNFKPAMNNGSPVKSNYHIPIMFHISEE